MGLAQRKPDDGPERAEVFVAEAQEKYSDAIAAARLSSETTATEAWKRVYRDQMTAHRKAINDAINDVTAGVDSIQGGDSTETVEKLIKDGVKAIAEERIRHTAWMNRAIAPHKSSVTACDEIRTSIITKALRAEEESPLVNSGLAADVRKVVDGWPKPSWNDGDGCVLM